MSSATQTSVLTTWGVSSGVRTKLPRRPIFQRQDKSDKRPEKKSPWMSCDWHPINEADHSRNKEDDRDYDVPDEGHVKALSHRPADHDSSNVAMRIDFDNSSLKFRWRRIWRLLLDLFDSHLT